MSDDVRGPQISVQDDARRLREKVAHLWLTALRVIRQIIQKTGGHTPTFAESSNTFTVDSADPATFTLDPTHPRGWNGRVIQLGAGQVECVAGEGATVNAAGAPPRTRTQFSVIEAEVVDNTDGQSAAYVVSGDIG